MAILKNATQQEFADFMGISQAEVSRLVKKGFLTRHASLGQWLKEYGLHMRDLAAGWKSDEGNLDLIHERARLAARQSEKLEIDTAKLRGSLFPSDVVIEIINLHNSTIRSRLLAMPARLKAQRPEMEIDAVIALTALIRETLFELTHVRLSPSIDERTRQYFSDLHAAAKSDGNGMGGRTFLSQSRIKR